MAASSAPNSSPRRHRTATPSAAFRSISRSIRCFTKTLPFDVFKDFAPIILVAKIPSILVVYPKLPIYSVQDLINEVRAHPGTITFASLGGVGTGGHVAGRTVQENDRRRHDACSL